MFVWPSVCAEKWIKGFLLTLSKPNGIGKHEARQSAAE